MSKQNKENQGNKYLQQRESTIQGNQKKMRELGLKNFVNSLPSLVQSQKMKKKTVKQKSDAGDVDFIPDPGDDGDDSEEEYQQVSRKVVVSKKQHRPQYIPPLSMNRVANLTKLHRVVAPNISQKVPSTSNVAKLNKRPATVTMSEINKGNKGVAKRRLVLVEEDDDEDDEEIFQEGNGVNMEVDDVDQYGEYDDMDNTIHTNNQYDIQMEDHNYSEDEDNVQERLQEHEKEKATGAPKKVRGHTQKAEIWRMNSTKRIHVTFNKFGKPVGDEGNELVQYLGTLVRNADHVSIEYSDWRKVPLQNKEDMYSLVKSKFTIHPDDTSKIKKWIFHSMGKKWRTWKGLLKSRGYDPSLSIDEIVAEQTNNDKRVNPTQFKELVTRWFTPKYQSTCASKRSSRSKMKEPHVTGSKSFARLAHEVAMKNDGIYPTRGEMYVTTRTRKDGSIVDDKATDIVTSLKAIASDSTSTPGDPDDFTNDDYSKVKGPEKRGYVRIVGRMPATKINDDSSTSSQTIHRLESAVNVMMSIIQEHIPSANLSTVLSNMNMQVPGIGSTAPKNSFLSTRSHDNDDRVDNM